MVTNSRLVLILVCFLGIMGQGAAAIALGPIGKYLKETRFQSGYLATEDCERRLTSTAPAFRKQALKEQIFELHRRTHDAVVAVMERNQPVPLEGAALQDFAVRLRIIGETSAKQLRPYSGELLAMAFEAGALTYHAHQYESPTLLNFTPFFEKVLDVAHPQNSVERALAASAAASLAIIRSTLILRSKEPADRLRGTLEVLTRASGWSDHTAETVFPLINASLIATVNAISAYPRVPQAQRPVYVAMTEALFAGAEVMLKQMSLRGHPNVRHSLRILIELHASPERKLFPKVDAAVEEWARLLGVEDGGGPEGSDAIN